MEPRRQCTAKSKQSQQRCKRYPIPGGTVCVIHGGGIPRVKAKARDRLLADQLCREFGLSRAKDPERVIAEVGCIAFSQIGDFYDEKGNFLAIHDMAPHVQAAIAGTETSTGNIDKGDGKKDLLVKLKVWDKPKMLEMLAKHHKLIGDVEVNVNVTLLEERIRAAQERVK